MIVSSCKEDYIEVDESWLRINENVIQKKIHLVKICFRLPTEDKLDQLLYILPRTNRFIIDNNIKFYNDYFKKTKKKYYVENSYNDETKFISFLRKNNKILLNFTKITSFDLRQVLFYLVREDLLNNIEILKLSKTDFELYKEHFETWDGNIIIME